LMFHLQSFLLWRGSKSVHSSPVWDKHCQSVIFCFWKKNNSYWKFWTLFFIKSCALLKKFSSKNLC
jgi:hypothetical protein